MKKLLRKLPRRKSQESAEQTRERITNETVAEHRERILAGGRKFKYPVQVAKHRLVITSVAIGIIAVALLTLLTWQQLYIAQNTSNFMYRITQLIPLQVASVDGYGVRYSDYLKKYRSSVHYLQQQNSINLSSEDGHRQAEFIKRREITNAEKNAYAMKLAGQKNIKVSGKEVNDFIQRDLTAKRVSQEAYERTVLKSFYDWTLDDYKDIVHTELLKRKVSFAVDTAAKSQADALHTQLASGADFATVAKASSDDVATKANGGDVGILPIDNQDPNGLIAAAKSLQPNQLSGVITGADGYYIIKLIEKTDTTIRYAQIKISLHAFDTQFTNLQKTNKIHEYIKLEQ